MTTTMDGVFFLQFLLSFLNTLVRHTYSELVPRPVCCPRNVESGQELTNSSGSCGVALPLSLRKVWNLDLNETFFINNILVEAITSDNDSVSVDIGTTSCETFQRECYVTCYTRQVVQRTGCYVTINITCSVTNVKGRYVRLRQNRVTALALCDVRIMGWSFSDRSGWHKNYALNAPSTQSPTFQRNYNASYAVDGNRLGSVVNKSCSRIVSPNITNFWWKVEFPKLILLSHVIIAAYLDSSPDERLSNFTVELGRFQVFTLCRNFGGVVGNLTTLNCTQSNWSKSLRISKTGKSLTLCEVEVYGDQDDNITRVPVSDLTSNVSCNSLIESQEPATSLESPEENASSTEIPEEDVITRGTPEENTTTFETSEQNATTRETLEENATTSEMPEENATTRETPEQHATTRETPEQHATTRETPEQHATTRETPEQNATNRATPQENSNPTTTKMVTATAIQKHVHEQTTGYCTCHCHFPVEKSQESVQQEVKETVKELVVRFSQMSKQVRKKSSIPDKRLSSQAVGLICTLAISSIFAAIAVCDVCRLLHYVLNRRRENL